MNWMTRWVMLAVVTLAGGCLQIMGWEEARPGWTGDGGMGTGGATSVASTTSHASAGSGGVMACVPGDVKSCYDGPAGTEGVGLCKAGKQTCRTDGSGFDACAGAVTPQPETCAVTDDEDCSGHDCVSWAGLFGDDTDQQPSSLAVDGQGNTYVVGVFYGAIELPSGSLINAGGGDVFLIKLGPDGSVLWGRRFGDSTAQYASSVAVDLVGNVIVGGYSLGSVDFGGGKVPAGAFVTKLDASGEHVWSKGLGNTKPCGFVDLGVSAVSATPQNDVVVGGYFCGTIQFDDGPVTAQPSEQVGFVMKLRGSDGSGKAADDMWYRRFNVGAVASGPHVAVDSAGNVLLASPFIGPTGFDFGSVAVSKGASDVVVAKLTQDGSLIWSKSFGGTDFESVTNIALDNLGGLIITGGMGEGVDFGDGVPSTGSGYIVKFNTLGAHQWHRPFGFGGVAADKGGNVYFAGTLKDSMSFGGEPLTAAGTGKDVVVVKLASDGALLWNRRYGDDADQYANAVGVGPGGEPIVLGWAKGTIDFGAGSLTAAGGVDGFIAKLSP